MTDEEKVKAKYPDATYHEESKWWQAGVWRKGIVPIFLGSTWADAARKAEIAKERELAAATPAEQPEQTAEEVTEQDDANGEPCVICNKPILEHSDHQYGYTVRKSKPVSLATLAEMDQFMESTR